MHPKAVNSLLKKALLRSQPDARKSKGATLFIHMLIQRYIVLCPDHDAQQTSNLISILEEIRGESLQNKMKFTKADLEYVRSMISILMPGFIDTVQKELPIHAEKLVAIDWRSLFGIDELPVEEKVAHSSDDNSPHEKEIP